MKKFKVEITKTYCIDVLAENEDEAKAKAEPILDEKMADRLEHYFESKDTEYTFYDVTNTEDEFNPQ
jgi:hypothetical protein